MTIRLTSQNIHSELFSFWEFYFTVKHVLMLGLSFKDTAVEDKKSSKVSTKKKKKKTKIYLYSVEFQS